MSDIQFSKFMRNLIEEMENKGLSDKTIKNYIQRLYFINGKKKFQSLAFLRKTDEVIKYLKDNLSVSTQKSYAGTIMSILEMKPSKINDKLKKIYNSFISDEEMDKIKSGEIFFIQYISNQSKTYIHYFSTTKMHYCHYM